MKKLGLLNFEGYMFGGEIHNQLLQYITGLKFQNRIVLMLRFIVSVEFWH